MRTPSDRSSWRSLAPALWAARALATGTAPARADDGPAAFAIPKEARAVLAAHRAGYHSEGGKGEVDVTALDKLKPGYRLDALNEIQDQLFYKMMQHSGDPGHKTFGDWYTTLLNAHGNPVKHSGDPDPGQPRFGLDQTGAIKPFLS